MDSTTLILSASVWFVGIALPVVILFFLVKALFPTPPSDETLEAAKWVGIRIGALHALIISLAFSGVRAEYNEYRETIENEALAIEQLYLDLDGLKTVQTDQIQLRLTEYVQIVVEQEWPVLHDGQLLASADDAIREISNEIVQLASGQDNSALMTEALANIHKITNARGKRSFDIEEPISTVFWLIAGAGLLFTSICFFAFTASVATAGYLALFAGMNGLVFFAIWSFMNPFSGVLAVSPDAFITVLHRTLDAD